MMNSTWKKYLLYATYTLLASGLLYGLLQLILSGYAVDWTGFQTKTLWDWMDLLIIPIVLAFGAFFLNRSERALEREIAQDRQEETALQTYLDRISELLLQKDDGDENRKIIRIRTLSIMRALNSERTNLVIQFLREANLITDEQSIFCKTNFSGINLSGLDFKNVVLSKSDFYKTDFGKRSILIGVNLEKANLCGAKLPYAYMHSANLHDALLEDANMERVTLPNANLQQVYLKGANLREAYLRGANLQNANLESANLKGATLADTNLAGANLKGAKVTPEQLAQAKSLKGTIMPDGTVHE